MQPEQAKRIVVQLVSNSSFFRGFIEAHNAWGRTGFPVADETVELKNLSNFFIQIGNALSEEQQTTKTN